MNKVVGVVGMCGAGKSVATDFFTQRGWNKIYFGGVTMEELHKRGMEVNEANERAVREELRRNYGPAAFAVVLSDRITASAEKVPTVLDGLYSWQEYVHLKQLLGDDLVILAVITDRAVRYERLSHREVRPLTAIEATNRDISEIENLAKGGPIAIADHFVMNNGSEEELTRQLEDFIASL